jgi:hypothetical protein
MQRLSISTRVETVEVKQSDEKIGEFYFAVICKLRSLRLIVSVSRSYPRQLQIVSVSHSYPRQLQIVSVSRSYPRQLQIVSVSR